jgi:hypothetical protein
MLPVIFSLSTTYGLVAFPYLTPVVKFTAYSFGHFSFSLQHSSVLQAKFSELPASEFSSSQDIILQYTIDNIAC